MSIYRVSFVRKINNIFKHGFIDVPAKNQKDAKDYVLFRLYSDNGKDNFFPFYRKAKKINPNEMCHSIVWE